MFCIDHETSQPPSQHVHPTLRKDVWQGRRIEGRRWWFSIMATGSPKAALHTDHQGAQEAS